MIFCFFYFIDRVDGPCTHDRVDVRGGWSRRRPWRLISRTSVAADREDVRGPIPGGEASPAGDRRRAGEQSGGALGIEEQRRRAELRVAREQRIAEYKV